VLKEHEISNQVYIKFQPHLNSVATLPCDWSCEMRHSLLLHWQVSIIGSKRSAVTVSLLRHFEHANGRQATDDARGSVNHQTEVGLFGVMKCGVACSRNETVSRTLYGLALFG